MRAAARVAHIIDGDSLSMNRVGFNVDWRRLHKYACAAHPLDVTTLNFNGVEYFKEDGNSQNRRLLDYLSMNGFRVKSSPANLAAEGAVQRARLHVMVGLTIDMLLAANSGMQEVIVWSGDGAMVPAVEAAQKLGASVTVIAVDAYCSNALKIEADNFIDLGTLRGSIERVTTGSVA